MSYLSDVKIVKTDDIHAKVYINGQEIDGVFFYDIQQSVNDIQKVTLRFYARTSMEVAQKENKEK